MKRSNGLGRTRGFTLSELLTTLGIIGIIAALTMPTLINNIQKKAWTNQLKKEYANITQSFKLMLANDNTESLQETSVFQAISGENKCFYNNPAEDENCNSFFNEMRKVLKIADIRNDNNYQYRELKQGSDLITYNDAIITLLSGVSIFNFKFYKETIDKKFGCGDGNIFCGNNLYIGEFYLDINGSKGPNTLGKDIFYFMLSEAGNLYPYASKGTCSFICGGNYCYWKNVKDLCGTPNTKDAVKIASGIGCTARIMENNWVMNY
ncbi:type II secretion system protein [bacterium]|nr:type II secretion system protein [bacterium]